MQNAKMYFLVVFLLFIQCRGMERDKNIKESFIYYERGLIKGREKSKWKTIISDSDKAIDLNPQDAMSFNRRACAKYNLGDYKGAITDFSKAIEFAPNDAKKILGRAIAKHHISDWSAIIDYDSAIQIDPILPRAYYSRGLIRHTLNDLKGALGDWEKAIELDPSNYKDNLPIKINEIKNDFITCKDFVVAFDKIIEGKPENADVYYRRGLAKYRLGNYEDAIEDFNKAIEFGIKNTSIYNIRGYIKYRIGNYKDAIVDWEKFIEIEPSTKESFYSLIKEVNAGIK